MNTFTNKAAILDPLYRSGWLEDIDVHFAALLAELDPQTDETLLLAAALTSQRTQSGDVCVDLNDHALTGAYCAHLEQSVPETSAWIGALRRAPVVGRPGDYRPLVLDDHGRMYLYRCWAQEKRLAEALIGRLHAKDIASSAALDRLAPTQGVLEQPAAQEQREATLMAVRRPLSIISGGPGTGKTNTAVSALALLAQMYPSEVPRVALTAATGKAAANLRDALVNADPELRLAAVLDHAEAATLHRLLGFRPAAGPTHDAQNPLDVDVVVVDEASMVDLKLMAALLDAMPDSARLILLGDPDQLASVESGAVLRDLCAGLSAYNNSAEGPTLGRNIATLRHSWRFGPHSGIGQLARAINAGDAERALTCLAASQLPDVTLRACNDSKALDALLEQHAVPTLAACVGNDMNLLELAECHAALRLLAVHRRGVGGAIDLNQRIEDALRSQGHIAEPGENYSGRPIMIDRNDAQLQLYNGDFGFVVRRNGEIRVGVPGAQGDSRDFHPARLPEHHTAYAITCHKSQGSEFGKVILVLPTTPSPVLSRQLLYTAVTRATATVEIWGSERVVAETIGHPTRRVSGLVKQLRL